MNHPMNDVVAITPPVAQAATATMTVMRRSELNISNTIMHASISTAVNLKWSAPTTETTAPLRARACRILGILGLERPLQYG